MAWFNPQKEDALRVLLARQQWKCFSCQFDYKPFLIRLLGDAYKGFEIPPLEDISWYYLKRLKRKVPKDRKPEVDHILAISKGGQFIGLDNHQVLCYLCHKIKTKSDLSWKKLNSV